MKTIISQSRLKDWRRCHKLHDYKWNQHLKRKFPPRPMLVGQIVHEMLDCYAKDQDPLLALSEHERKLKPFLREDPETYGDLIHTCGTLYANYVEHYREDGLTFEASELEVELEMGYFKVVIHIDKLVSDPQVRLWVMDHKCMKSIPDQKRRMADLQLTVYPFVYNLKHPKQRVNGIIWDYIRTKLPVVPDQLKNGELSKRSNMDTTFETYKAEITRLGLDEANYADILESLKQKGNTFYDRVYLPTANDEMTSQVWEDLLMTSEDISDSGETHTDRNLSFDCDRCQFFELCKEELRGLDSVFIRKSQFIEEAPRGYEEADD